MVNNGKEEFLVALAIDITLLALMAFYDGMRYLSNSGFEGPAIFFVALGLQIPFIDYLIDGIHLRDVFELIFKLTSD